MRKTLGNPDPAPLHHIAQCLVPTLWVLLHWPGPEAQRRVLCLPERALGEDQPVLQLGFTLPVSVFSCVCQGAVKIMGWSPWDPCARASSARSSGDHLILYGPPCYQAGLVGNRMANVALTQAGQKCHVKAFSFSCLRYWLLGNYKLLARLAVCFELLWCKRNG